MKKVLGVIPSDGRLRLVHHQINSRGRLITKFSIRELIRLLEDEGLPIPQPSDDRSRKYSDVLRVLLINHLINRRRFLIVLTPRKYNGSLIYINNAF